jgi:hypothetical protein
VANPWEKYQPQKEPAPQAADGAKPWDKYSAEAKKEEPGLISKGLTKLESWFAAPNRAALSAAQEGQNPLTAWGKQFNADPAAAPTDYDIAKKSGLGTDKKLLFTADQMREMDEKNNPGRAMSMKQVGMKHEDQYSSSPAEIGAAALNLANDPFNALPLLGKIPKVAGGATKALSLVDDAVKGGAGKLGAAAEKAAVRATGATGAQASKFAEDAGRELLDRNLVRFADSPQRVASRTGKALDAANAEIDSALKSLDAKGVKVDAEKISSVLQEKINALRADPSKADVAKILEGELDNVAKAAKAKGAPSVPVSEAEQIKRGYNRKAGNWMDPEKGQAGKEMYQTYRRAVEDAATAADPALAGKFKDAKDTYGLLAPIQEAAERRGLTTQQSPLGGLLDISTGGAGAMVGGPVGAVAAPIARRVVAPRLASSWAVTLDSAAGLLRKVPEMAALEAKDPAAFSALVKLAVEKPGLLHPGGMLKVSGDQ